MHSEIYQQTYEQALREFHIKVLGNALIRTRGNIGEAALALEMHRNTFTRLLQEASLMPVIRVLELLREAGSIPARKPKARAA